MSVVFPEIDKNMPLRTGRANDTITIFFLLMLLKYINPYSAKVFLKLKRPRGGGNHPPKVLRPAVIKNIYIIIVLSVPEGLDYCGLDVFYYT